MICMGKADKLELIKMKSLCSVNTPMKRIQKWEIRHEKVINIFSHQGNTKENHNEMITTYQSEWVK